MPKINLLYYKSLLDQCFCKFFELHEDFFVKSGSNYVLASCPSRSKLQKMFFELLKEQILKYVQPYDVLQPSYCLVLGACQPRENILLSFKDSTFPERLSNLIDSKVQLKYILKEHDIQIDLPLFNQVLDDIFDKLFSSRKAVVKLLGDNYKNVIFIKHRSLDCYALLKTVKFLYGRSNCVNLYEQKFYDKRCPLVAVNELIDKFVHSKTALNKSQQFKDAMTELKQFISQKIEEVSQE